MVFFGRRVAGLNPRTGHGVEMPLSKTTIPKALSTAPSSSLCDYCSMEVKFTKTCKYFFVSSYNNSEYNNIFSFEQYYQLILMNVFFSCEKTFNKSFAD